MALPQRIETPAAGPAPIASTPAPSLAPVAGAAASPWGERPDGYDPGGEVGRMHAELTARLVGTGRHVEQPQERLIRLLSVGGGYLALAAGYLGVALLLLR